PQIERIDRLHIVVAIEDDALAPVSGGRTFGEHDRVPVGRVNFGGDVERGQVGGQADSRRFALVRVSRIGGDRLDGKENEKSVEAVVGLDLDWRKNPVEIGHGCLPLIAAAASTVSDRSPFSTATDMLLCCKTLSFGRSSRQRLDFTSS